MENKKICRFCRERIDKELTVCPVCSRELNKLKFYQQNWFMWVMLIVFTPVGLALMWNFHPEIKKNTKIVLTIIFSAFFIIVAVASRNNTYTEDAKLNNNTGTQNSSNVADNTISSSVTDDHYQKSTINVIDFSQMNKEDVKKWCNENKLKCNIRDEYSDNVEKGTLISQSISANTNVTEGNTIDVIYSLGKKVSAEYTNALKKAEAYSKSMNMSKKGIYDQLTSEYGEKFTADAAQYAIDNLEADYKTNALEKARSYQNSMHMSKNAIYDQLTSEYGEKFTEEEAKYAVDNLND